MSLSISQSATAVGPGLPVSFLAAGGVGLITWAVTPGGAGGTIDQQGFYTSPAVLPDNPKQAYDFITATDENAVTVAARVEVGDALALLREIFQHELGLADDRVYLWDQKINQPSDNGLYIAISVPYVRVYANNNRPVSAGAGLNAEQYVSCAATVDLDIISRGPAARNRKELVVMATMSDYAARQMEANSFYIARMPSPAKFINLSQVDGAAIPYRYRISFNMLYTTRKTAQTQFYDQFAKPIIYTDQTVTPLTIIYGGDPATTFGSVIIAGGSTPSSGDIINGGGPAST